MSVEFSAREGWLTNPRFDITFLTAFPVIFFIILLGIFKLEVWPVDIFAAYFLSMPHIAATLAIVYLNRSSLLKRPLLYIWVPLLLTATFYISYFFYSKQIVINIVFNSIIGHEILQYYFILSVFYLMQDWRSRVDTLISQIAIIAGPVYCFLYSFGHTPFPYSYFGMVSKLPVNPQILNLLKIVAFLAIAVFIFRQIYNYVKWKSVSWFAILMVLIANAMFFITIVTFKDKDLFLALSFRTHHAIQYLAWLLFYYGLKFKGRIMEGAKFLSYLFLPRRIPYFLVFLLLIAFILNKAKAFLFYHNIGNPASLYLAVLHVYLDAVLWLNIKKTAKLAA